MIIASHFTTTHCMYRTRINLSFKLLRCMYDQKTHKMLYHHKTRIETIHPQKKINLKLASNDLAVYNMLIDKIVILASKKYINYVYSTITINILFFTVELVVARAAIFYEEDGSTTKSKQRLYLLFNLSILFFYVIVLYTHDKWSISS